MVVARRVIGHRAQMALVGSLTLPPTSGQSSDGCRLQNPFDAALALQVQESSAVLLPGCVIIVAFVSQLSLGCASEQCITHMTRSLSRLDPLLRVSPPVDAALCVCVPCPIIYSPWMCLKASQACQRLHHMLHDPLLRASPPVDLVGASHVPLRCGAGWNLEGDATCTGATVSELDGQVGGKEGGAASWRVDGDEVGLVGHQRDYEGALGAGSKVKGPQVAIRHNLGAITDASEGEVAGEGEGRGEEER